MFTHFRHGRGLAILAVVAAASAQTPPPSLPVTAGLVLHLESDHGLVLAQARVERWSDRSPLGNDFFGSGGVTLLPAATPSGAAAVNFDGATGMLQRTHATHPLQGFPTGSGNRTLITLVRYHSAPVAAGFAYGSPNANRIFGVGVRAGTGVLQVQTHMAANNNISSSVPGVGAGWLIQSAVHAAGTTALFRNGDLIAQEKKNLSTSLTRAVLGQDLLQSGALRCEFAAVLLFDRALSPDERSQVEAYLSDKYLHADENTPPVVTILHPPDGASIVAGQWVDLAAQVTDLEDPDLAAQVNWASDLEGPLGLGATLTVGTLRIGTHVITASVTDRGGLPDVDSITLQVHPAPPRDPSVTLNSAPATLVFGGPWSHALSGSDPDGDLVRLELHLRAPASEAWTLAHEWSFESTFSASVQMDARPFAVGAWTARAVATDGGGRSAVSTSTTVSIASAQPVGVWVDWARPAEAGGTYEVTAADLDARFVHPFNEAAPSPTGAIAYRWAPAGEGTWSSLVAGTRLAEGTYVVQARYPGDEYYTTAEVTVQLTVLPPVATPPLVTIVDPADGSEWDEDVAARFSAIVTDEQEDGDLLAEQLRWFSDRDGELGQGASIEALLSAGSHVITARVTDASGLEATDEIQVLVRASEGLVLDGLVLRLEANSAVTAAAGAVQRWDDLSGAENHLHAVGAPKLLVAVTPAGSPAIRFDGIGDALERRAPLYPIAGFPTLEDDRTLIVAARFHASTTAAGVSYGGPGAHREFGLVAEESSGQVAVQTSSTGEASWRGGPAFGSGWMLLTGRVRSGVVELFREGELVASGAAVLETDVDLIAIGRAIDGPGHAAMEAAAVLVYDRALADAEHQRVLAYLEGQLRAFTDADGDGLADPWEIAHFIGLQAGPEDDVDEDGVVNREEYQRGLDPNRSDSDGDGLPDGWELLYQLDPYIADADGDEDMDGQSNGDEFLLGRNPRAGAVPDDGDSLRLRVFEPAN